MGNQKKYAQQIEMLVHKKIRCLLSNEPWSRAMLAKLRRGVGKQPGELPELFEILFADMPEELFGKSDEPSYSVKAIYTALTLFALHQQGKERPMSIDGKTEDKKLGNSLGSAVGRLVKQDNDREQAIKRRFDTVTTATELTELSHHARSLIQLLRAGDITLDYPRFAVDLYWFQFDEIRNRARLRWGQDYYLTAQTNIDKVNGGISNE